MIEGWLGSVHLWNLCVASCQSLVLKIRWLVVRQCYLGLEGQLPARVALACLINFSAFPFWVRQLHPQLSWTFFFQSIHPIYFAIQFSFIFVECSNIWLYFLFLIYHFCFQCIFFSPIHSGLLFFLFYHKHISYPFPFNLFLWFFWT